MILLFTLLLPAASTALIPLKKHNRNLFYILLLLFAISHLVLSLNIAVDTRFATNFLDLSFAVDSYTKIFLLLISVSWIISILYAYDFNKYNFKQKNARFFLFLNILLSVILLNACAANLSTLFIFYVAGVPLTYPLIMLGEGKKVAAAGRSFVLQTLIPPFIFLLPAIFITYYCIGNTSFSPHSTFDTAQINPYLGGLTLFLFLIGLSKNAIMPFHTWLPRTYIAPAPVSGLIHSVAAVKTASIASIKIVVYIFGLDYIKLLTSNFFTGGFIIYICGITAVYTAYRALKTQDIKRRFSYSTVGQLSYIILAILIGTKTGIMAATLHIFTHAIAKSCLFYVAGFFNSVYGTTYAPDVARIMPSTKFVAFVVAICGLSITGFPFLAGYHSKDLMLIEEWHTGNYMSSIFLLAGSIINIFYIYPVVRSAFRPVDTSLKVEPIPLSMLLTFIISVLLILSSSFYMTYLTSFID